MDGVWDRDLEMEREGINGKSAGKVFDEGWLMGVLEDTRVFAKGKASKGQIKNKDRKESVRF